MGSNFGYSLIWVILLIFVAWPVSAFLAAVWIFLMVRHYCSKRFQYAIQNTKYDVPIIHPLFVSLT